MTDDQLRDEAAARLLAHIQACPKDDYAAIQRACHAFSQEWSGFADAAVPIVAAEAAGVFTGAPHA